MNRIGFLKFLDRIVGSPLAALLPTKARLSADTFPPLRKVLFIRPGGIGDAVLLLPAIRALRTKFAELHIDVLCEKRNAGVFGLSREVDRVYLYDRLPDLLKCLRSEYDAVIDTEQWHRLSAVVAYLTGAPERVGFDTNDRARLLTRKVPYSHDDYEVHSFFRLVEPLIGCPQVFQPDAPFIEVPDGSFPRGVPVFPEGNEIIAIFPGASVVERRWGGERFGEVAGTFEGKGYTIVILGSAADKGEAERIKVSSGCIDLAGRTSLAGAAAVLKRSSLLLTADSGLMHIAYAVGTPTVSLFGSGIERKWAPKGQKHVVVSRHLPCSPCTKFGYTPGCGRDVECLRSLSAGEVICAMEELLVRTACADRFR